MTIMALSRGIWSNDYFAMDESIKKHKEKKMTQQKLIKLRSEDHQLSAVKLTEKIGVASRNIENNIKKLKEYGILIRHGSPKNGYWEIVDKDLQE